MGTVPSTLGKVIFETAEKGLSKLGSKYGGQTEAITEGTQKLMNKTFGLESTLTGKSGELTQQHLKMFESVFDGHLSAGVKAAQQHQQQTGQIVPRYVIETQARTKARNQVFGNKDEILAAITHATSMEHGEEKAKNLVDNLGVYFHEQVKQGDTGQFGARLTSNLHKNPMTTELQTRPSPYNKREFFNDHPGIEPFIHTLSSMSFAFKAGLAHTTTPLNGLIGNSLMSFAKASAKAFGPDYANSKAMLQTYNALGSIFLEEHDQMYKFRNGIISKYAPGSIGEFIHKNFAIPGFTAMKQRTATMFALQGKYSAEEYAQDLLSGDLDKMRMAGNNLTWLGINPKDVMSNGGKLTNEQIRQAMFENTNQKLFIQSSARNRSQWATASPLGRITSMYHGYGAAQSNFIQRELHKLYINKDVMGMIKTIAILGTVFPAVGVAVHGLEQVWMHPTKASEKITDSKDKLEHMLIDPAFAERLEGISNTAGFGVMSSFSRASGRRKLASAMIGPFLNAGSELVQDFQNIDLKKDSKKGSNQVKSWEPLARDVLHDIPSLGIGSFLSDEFLPNQNELNKRKPMTSRRLAAQQAAKKRKMKEQKEK